MSVTTYRCMCNITLQVDAGLIGQHVQCPNCGMIVVVPESSNPEDPSRAQPAFQNSNPVSESNGIVPMMKWLEPTAMRRMENKVFNRWVSLLLILGMGLFGIVMRAITEQGSSPHSYSMVFWGCAGVGVLFDFARRIFLYVPSIVIISQQGINRNTMFGGGNMMGWHLAFWPWHAIGSGKIEDASVGKRSVRFLKLYSYDHQEIASIGMAKSVHAEQLERQFAAMGKKLARISRVA